MDLRNIKHGLALCLCAFLSTGLYAQLNVGGVPQSFSRALAPDNRDIMIVTPPAVDRLLAEDKANPVPYRFAVNLPVDIGFTSFQSREVVDGMTEVRRFTVYAPGALGLTLYFDQFELPEGAKLFVYNPERTQLIGAFTSLNNNRYSTFATSLVRGEKLTIEYDAPVGTANPLFHISELAYAYRGLLNEDGINTGFGASGKCEVNVNCSEGTAWQEQKRGVTRIQIKRGTATLYCTGSVVNNTKNDGKPYILTADHCGRLSTDIDLTKWIFYFNYEAKTCAIPTTEPWASAITGAKKIASGGEGGNNGSDFFLVLLNTSIPDTFHVHYNGWSRDTIPSYTGVTIHHPEGDIKKVSTYTTPVQASYWSGDSKLAHWRVVWSETVNGHATTEFGSSGSPLFDNHGHIIGTLTGGDSSCDSTALGLPDYYGMFSYHWDKNGTDSTQQLKPWLDPINANVMELNGWALSSEEKADAAKIELSPNPVTDLLTIRGVSMPEGKISISVNNLVGNVVKKISIPATGVAENLTVDVSSLSQGVYILIIRYGDKVVTRKFMKIPG